MYTSVIEAHEDAARSEGKSRAVRIRGRACAVCAGARPRLSITQTTRDARRRRAGACRVARTQCGSSRRARACVSACPVAARGGRAEGTASREFGRRLGLAPHLHGRRVPSSASTRWPSSGAGDRAHVAHHFSHVAVSAGRSSTRVAWQRARAGGRRGLGSGGRAAVRRVQHQEAAVVRAAGPRVGRRRPRPRLRLRCVGAARSFTRARGRQGRARFRDALSPKPPAFHQLATLTTSKSYCPASTSSPGWRCPTGRRHHTPSHPASPQLARILPCIHGSSIRRLVTPDHCGVPEGGREVRRRGR